MRLIHSEMRTFERLAGDTIGLRFARTLAVAGALCCVAFGCRSGPVFEFDEMDLVATDEKLSELSLGHFQIPIPAPENRLEKRAAKRNRLQVDFQLFALVPPIDKRHIEGTWKRQEGTVRDRVIRICRNATLEELHEPELETLKARLMDAIGPHLGDEVHHLLITEVVSREI